MDLQQPDYSFQALCELIQQFAPCMNDYLYAYDLSTDNFYITERAVERFLIPTNRFQQVVDTLKTFVYPEDFPVLQADLQEMLDYKKDTHNLEYRWLGRDGSPIWINCRGRLLKNSRENPAIMIGCINEIGKQQKADNISGLLGESSFKEQLKQISPIPDNAMMMRIGIDDFKTINERHGTQYGDFVLHEVAECIRKCLEPNQYVYRIVSDEFMLLDLTGSDYQSMYLLYYKIRSQIDQLVSAQDYKAIYTISAGLIAVKDVEHTTPNDYIEAMKLSEFALTEAKNQGKNQLYFFRPEDYTTFLRKRYIQSSLRQAVSDNFKGFDLYFQPIIMTNGEALYAAETLLRFKTPSGENISPVEFVPILEESGLIIPVGKWIMKNALAMCKKVRTVYPDFLISINISYIQLLKTPLFENIREALTEAALPPSCLIVELTESGHLEDNAILHNTWEKLKEIGVLIALDDFGTGYSNLINISNLKPNIVKIDRSFTLKALNNDYEFELLIHIIHMVHSLGLNLVVEGIETIDELVRITELNPDFIQGFYYSMPCPLKLFYEKYHIPASVESGV